MMLASYLLKLLHLSCDTGLEQDALEYAITSNHVRLTYDLKTDVAICIEALPQAVEGWQRMVHAHMESQRSTYGVEYEAVAA